MSKYDVRQLRLGLVKTLMGCAGWALFAICGMNAGWLNDFWGTAVLIACTAVAGSRLDKYIWKMERRWSI